MGKAGEMRFRDQVVWITGASSGLGEALVPAFHGEGARVILSARRDEELRRVAASCGEGPGEIFVLPLDLADAGSLPAKAAAALDRFGRIDILVNNAGRTQRALFKDTEAAVYRDLFEVNFFGPLVLTRLVLAPMVARKEGRIVVVSSIQYAYSTPLRSGYNAVKRALHGLFESIRAEHWADGIRITMVVLGAVRTNVSINAARGDGSNYGKMNRVIAEGLEPAEAARRILDGIAADRDEIVVASPRQRWLVWRARLFPRLAARAARLTPRPRSRGG